jgi:hypothetical protein
MSELPSLHFRQCRGTSIAQLRRGGHVTMSAHNGVSGPTRGMSGTDVMFLVSLAFIFFAFVITIAVVRP